MRTIVLMVRKDLLRVVRAPLAVLVMLVFPVVFALLIGMTFGTGDVEPPKVRLLIEDLDQTLVSDFLKGAFESEQAGKYFDANEVGPEGLELLERGKASALLRIPEGFAQDLLDGEPITFDLVRNPAESILPEIAEQTMVVLTEVLDAGTRLLRTPLDQLAPYLAQEDADVTATEVSQISIAFYDALTGVEKYVLPPVVTLDALQLQEKKPQENPDDPDASASSSPSTPGVFSVFLWMLPGVSVFALFMIGDTSMRDILTESTAGTLRRQFCGPVPAWKIVLGKAVYTASITLISLLILTGIGVIALDHPVSLVAFVALSMAVILTVTGFGALIYGLARSAGQGATLSSIVLLVFAFMGGSFLPLQSLPPVLRRLAPISPFYWATTGFQKLLEPGSNVAEILPNIGILASLGAALLVLGTALLGRRVRTGGAA